MTSQSKLPVALISGGAQRVGAEIARELHRADHNVVLHYRNSATEAQALADELNKLRADSAIITAADLLDTSSVCRIVSAASSHFGRLDVLVNNASSFYPTPVGDITTEAFDDLIGTNFKAPVFLSQAAAPLLRVNGRGVIINLGDIYAQRPMQDHLVYCAAKAALLSVTRSLARELAPDVRVNAVSPGAILWPEDTSVPTDRDAILARTPLARRGEPSDLARTVRFLVTEAPFVTGQIIAVDGGRSVVP